MQFRTPLFIFILSFTGGVALASAVSVPVSFLFLLVFLFFVLLFHFWYTRVPHVFLVSLCVLGVAAGIFRFSVSMLWSTSPVLEATIGRTVVLEGVVVEEPDVRDDTVRLVVTSKQLFEADGGRPVEKKILVVASRHPAWEYGDRISFRGKLAKPEAFADPDTGRIFDYPSYLGVEGIYYEMPFPKMSLLGKAEGNMLRGALFSLKRRFVENISRLIHEPQSSLLAGLVVGAKQSLGEELLEQFRRVGIIHIVVLSGYNITIIAESVQKVLGFLRPAISASLASLSIALFAVMVGAGPTVVRASLMALLVILARRLGRTYDVTTALLLAGFLMLLQNPKILAFDPSFQLSFLATVGLIYFSPRIERFLAWLPERFLIRDVAVATIATQLFVLPFLLYKIGEVSMVSLPVNLLVLLVIPLTMLFGFLAGALGFLGAAVAVPFALVAQFFLFYMLFISSLFSKLPFAAFSVPYVPLFLVVLIYAVYGYMMFRERRIPLLWAV